MDERSTQVKSDKAMDKHETYENGVSAKTLNFLKMLARSYHVEPTLPTGLNATCVN